MEPLYQLNYARISFYVPICNKKSVNLHSNVQVTTLTCCSFDYARISHCVPICNVKLANPASQHSDGNLDILKNQLTTPEDLYIPFHLCITILIITLFSHWTTISHNYIYTHLQELWSCLIYFHFTTTVEFTQIIPL